MTGLIKMITTSISKFTRHGFVAAIALLLGACSSTPDRGPTSEQQEQELVKTYVGAAGIYLQRGQLKFAKEKIDKAMELDDRNVDVNNVMALYQWRIKQYKQADKYFRRAIDLGPENPESLNNYAVYLCDRGQIEDAVKYYDRAVAVPVYPAKVQAYTNAGKCLQKIKQDKRARTYYLAALKLNPYYPDAAGQMAKLTARSGELVSAKKYISNYFFRGKKTAEMVYLAMRIEETLGNRKVAAKYAQELLKTFPDSREAIWVKKRTKSRR